MDSTLNCSCLRFDPDRGWRCAFTGEDWSTYPNGCHSCIEVPSIKELLRQGDQEEQQNYRQQIHQAVKAGQATLVLGAGISIPMSMPNWQGLVSQMSGYALQYQNYRGHSNEADEQSDRLRLSQLERELITQKLRMFNGTNVLESGQYIAQALGGFVRDKSGEELIKEVLSAIIETSKKPETFLADWQAKHPDLGSEPDIRILAQDNTLCAVAYLLQAKGGIRHALTYNFDTLVEEYLIQLFHISSKRIISHPGEWSTQCKKGVKDPINIFHVHGCIPRLEHKTDPMFSCLQESRSVILSEDSYYDTERYEAYNWQNSIQSYYLNRNSCVFVGFSADDYNFRRILRQMGNSRHQNRSRPRHYLILTVDDIVRDNWTNICRSHLADGTSLQVLREDTLLLLHKLLQMKAHYWMRYGFYPIWASVQDIPEILLSLL